MTDQFDTLETNAIEALPPAKAHTFLTILAFESEVYPGKWNISITRKTGKNEVKETTCDLTVKEIAATIAQELASE